MKAKTAFLLLFLSAMATGAFADEKGYFGVMGAAGLNAYTHTWQSLSGKSYDDVKDAGLIWLLGLDYNPGDVRVCINYYGLGAGGSYAGIACQWAILDPYRGPLGSGEGGVYLGAGGGAGVYFGEGPGVEASATGGLAFPFGMVHVTGGLVITYVDLGSSGGVQLANWYLMAGVSLGLPNGELTRLLD